MAVTVTVPPGTTKLIALADLKAILGITDSANDTLLGNIIQRSSDAIARFCNRVFAQRTVIETLPGAGGQLLKLKFSPIVTLTSIAFEGETVDSDTYTLTEPDAGMVYREAGWFYTGHAYDYAATYTHGYNLPDMAGADTLPHDIQQAALELCKGMWLARQRDPSVSMESVPDVYTVQYGGQGRNGAPIGAIPPTVQELLLPYKEFKL
jgi:Phage gp6-like head-tail connector protein